MIPGEVVALMSRRRLVAEVKTESALHALGAIDALVKGGVSVVEVSLATPGAQEILSHFAGRPDVLVGAGAVLEPGQAAAAISYGARFISSPILAVDIVPVCREKNVACVLGALTPSEIIAAQRAGAEMVKLFPIEHLGGPAYVRALFRQLTHLSLQISGGFSAQTLNEYVALPIRSLAVGDLLVPRMLVQHQQWQALTNRARAFAQFFTNPQLYGSQLAAMLGAVPQQRAAAAANLLPPPQGQTPQPVSSQSGYMPAAPNNYPPNGLGQNGHSPTGSPPNSFPPNSLPPGGYPEQTPANPAASSSGFKPWDSRPIKGEGEEDWLR